MPLDPDLLGQECPAVEFSWEERDVMLYALAVGAGQDDATAGLELTTENTEGAPLRVLPTYANIITRGASVDFGDVDRTRLVHAEQSFRLHAPLPTSGRATTTARVTEVLDKGRAALVRTEASAVDAESGELLATTVQTVFIGGAGGFGGPRGEATTASLPDREPDDVVTARTRPEQALLYRLTGDRNPLHSDPAFAARGGFDRPILHGMCTYGFTGRILLETVGGGDPSTIAGMAARFTQPVFPGDELTVSIWRDGSGAAFRATRGDDVVLDLGRLDLVAETGRSTRGEP